MKPQFSYIDIGPEVCERCGVRGGATHLTVEDCVRVLQNVVTDLQARLDGRMAAGSKHDGSRQPGTVLLDDEYLTPDDCIDVLRDRIAVLEFQLMAHKRKPAPGTRGGYHGRRDARMVLLDGERLTLTEAARRLAMSASSLHFRILKRTGTADYTGVDLRAIHVEFKWPPKNQHTAGRAQSDSVAA